MLKGFSSTNCEISIIRVSNGFVVTMPVKELNQAIKEFEPLIGMVKGMIPGKDDVMEKIKEAQEQQEAEEQPTVASLPNVHIFKKWAEVLAFLKLQID